MSFQSPVPLLESFADKFAYRVTRCLFGQIQVDENYVDNSQGFSVNRTKEDITTLITYTTADYYADNENYDPSKPDLWPPPFKVDVINKLQGEGYTINSIHSAQIPYEWTTMSGIAKGDLIGEGEELSQKIAASEALAYELYWNLYGFNGRATFAEYNYVGDINVEATEIIDGEPQEVSFSYTRDDYYADVPQYDPEDTETYPDVTTIDKIQKIEENPDVTVNIALPTDEGSSVRSYYPIRTFENGILSNEQPSSRLCGIPSQNTGRTEFFTPYISTNLKFVRVYYGEVYIGMALDEIVSLNAGQCPFGLEAGQLALVDSLVGVGGYIMTNRTDTFNNRLYDLKYNKISTFSRLLDTDVLVEASAQTILDDGESYVDASNFKAKAYTAFDVGRQSTVELDPEGLRFWSYE
jgi:hypothetical protein